MYKFFFKRIFDLFFGLIFLILLLVPILLCFIIASLETKSFGFYFQKRVGQYSKIFYVIKIKTMKNVADRQSTITCANSSDITFFGAFFRKYKLDELPQLVNIILGQMSFVGPRPDVPGYADKLVGSDKIILNVRPGITGPASIFYRDEEYLLDNVDNPKAYNDDIIWPHKVFLNKQYANNITFKLDMKYLIKTVF